MANFSVATIFTAKDRITASFSRMASGADKFGNSADRAFKKASKSGSRLKDVVGGILAASAIQSSIYRLREFGSEIIDTGKKAQQLDVVFKSVFGKNATQEMAFVRKESERLGLQFDVVAKEFSKVAAATKQTNLEGKATKEIFLAVTEASTAMQLSADDTSGALRALTQIISKGKVQAEELRGQLGERIPGAFKLAARAMKVTEAELNKMMETGQVTAEKFIPAFAKTLREEFGGAAKDASGAFQAMENRFKNAMFGFKNSIGRIMLPILTRLFTGITKMLIPMTKWIEMNEFLIKSKIDKFINNVAYAFDKVGTALEIVKNLIPALKPVLAFWATYRSVLLGAAAAQGVLTLATTVFANLQAFVAFAQLAASVRTFSQAMALANLVMMANPVGLIIAGVVALGAAIAAVVIYWDEIIAGLENAWELAKDFLGFGDDAEKKITVKTEELNQAPNKKEADARAKMSVNVGGKFTFENAPPGMNFVQTKATQMQTSGLGAQ